MIIQNLADATISSLLNTWGGVIGFIPSLIGALIILIIGLIVAAGLKSLVERILSAVGSRYGWPKRAFSVSGRSRRLHSKHYRCRIDNAGNGIGG
ncbi:MAG: hypothetical protein UU85_C0004G0054 [Candidatus Wolfebacteria bacterium GW2011_GWA2_42_10]|uniref:Uncharacterized protein n=1 Tax=Candidatus Wolfebacteria bacterium GW2011_GWA2_42_10 TaxID=1619004 RepID=A0A0G0XK48_9BACT|nr:MAG: hypothetical protein UU85_C0004G0054 [Candidatus Wolfebacteria bacterium GW2011_GWA2_42_10]